MTAKQFSGIADAFIDLIFKLQSNHVPEHCVKELQKAYKAFDEWFLFEDKEN